MTIAAGRSGSMTSKARQKGKPVQVKFGEFPGFDSPAMRMASQPFDAWLRWQSQVLGAAGPAAEGWLTRRREALEATLRAFSDLATCRDLSDVARIQREWTEGEIERLQEDMRALGAQAFAMTREIAKAAEEAAETAEEAEPGERHPEGRAAA
jgi:hypothetical protein